MFVHLFISNNNDNNNTTRPPPQLFSQLFHFINMWLFNVLVREPQLQLCTRPWGVRLKARLGSVEQWAEKQGLELAADCHLCRIIQVRENFTLEYFFVCFECRLSSPVDKASFSSCKKIVISQVENHYPLMLRSDWFTQHVFENVRIIPTWHIY